MWIKCKCSLCLKAESQTEGRGSLWAPASPSWPNGSVREQAEVLGSRSFVIIVSEKLMPVISSWTVPSPMLKISRSPPFVKERRWSLSLFYSLPLWWLSPYGGDMLLEPHPVKVMSNHRCRKEFEWKVICVRWVDGELSLGRGTNFIRESRMIVKP